MTHRRERLIRAPSFLHDTAWEQAETERLAALPEASRHTDEDVTEFLFVAHALDSLNQQQLNGILKETGAEISAALSVDPYRLSRYILNNWENEIGATVRKRLQVATGDAVAWMRKEPVAKLLDWARRQWYPIGFEILRRAGFPHRIAELMAAMSEDQKTRCRAMMLYGRRLMHQCLTEAAPVAPGARTKTRRLLKRINLRENQVKTLRENLASLQREKGSLLARLQRTEGMNGPELDALTAEFRLLREQRAEAEHLHQARLAEQAEHYRAEIDRLRQKLQRMNGDYTETLAQLRPWASRRRRSHG